MKIVRVICLLLVSVLAISPLGTVLAQEKPRYALALTPSGERYNTTIIAGRDKDFGVELENLGTEAIDKITFSSNQPEGWTIKFEPAGVASLEAFGSTTIYANIKVPEATKAGDHMISLSASGKQASAEKIDIRVTVETPVVEEKIEMSLPYPTLEAIAGQGFEFEVEFKYTGSEPREFNLRGTGPEGWSVYMTPQYQKEKRLSAISLKPGFTYGDKIKVMASAPFWPLPEPGEYKITLEAVSGELKDTIELTAVITAMYSMVVVSTTERLNTTAKAGKDNFFSIDVQNLGTDAIDNIKFSSTKPTGWTIEFSPDKIESLPAIDFQTVDVNIKPPTETIAGDYQITVRASGEQASEKIDIRVTVETPTIWGWVGVGIILVVIAGLAYIFMRFSRR